MPTATPAPRPATAAEIDLIQQSITVTTGLKSYHYTVIESGDVRATQTLSLAGDFVAPDKAYATGTVANAPTELLRNGDQIYTKDASGTWTVKPAGGGGDNSPVTLTKDANLLAVNLIIHHCWRVVSRRRQGPSAKFSPSLGPWLTHRSICPGSEFRASWVRRSLPAAPHTRRR